ncbi:MAG: molybdenum cofactor guanylyltransferase [Candidatus Sericytochromatia bacterium]|nr:MAG: molybdenum cofactor guanylyltransferase [Candidatus Sericytochromatia bacterium]
MILKENNNYLFNNYEIFFCGFSGSGKTTLISKLTKYFSKIYSVGYIKHDAHKFSIDYENKDTHIIYNSGANKVFINDNTHFAFIEKSNYNQSLIKSIFNDCDFVFVEGYKYLDNPKVLIIDENKKILEEYNSGKINNVLCFVGEDSYLDLDKPYFNRNDITSISNFILNYFNSLNKKVNLYGLVLAGGKSTRMGRDKAELEYYGKKQVEYTCDLLYNYCNKVFISTRDKVYSSRYESIFDTFLNIGPIGGILSAQTLINNTAFFVIACDMPYINSETIEKLIMNRDYFKFSTCYINQENNLPEPLCAIYEPKSKYALMSFIAEGFSCPRKFLIKYNSKKILPNNPIEMSNINYIEEYNEIKGRI